MSASTDERLDRIAAILALANREPVKAAGEEIRSDPLSAAILGASSANWIGSARIRAAVAKKDKASERTVTRRLAELVNQGALYHRGAGASSEYRLTGLV